MYANRLVFMVYFILGRFSPCYDVDRWLFMFRKFLKRLPKEDGKSELDWQQYYIEQTRHLWSEKEKALLEDLVRPVPELFRDVARQKSLVKSESWRYKKKRIGLQKI